MAAGGEPVGRARAPRRRKGAWAVRDHVSLGRVLMGRLLRSKAKVDYAAVTGKYDRYSFISPKDEWGQVHFRS